MQNTGGRRFGPRLSLSSISGKSQFIPLFSSADKYDNSVMLVNLQRLPLCTMKRLKVEIEDAFFLARLCHPCALRGEDMQEKNLASSDDPARCTLAENHIVTNINQDRPTKLKAGN